MIKWPKPQEIGYNANGFRQQLRQILVQHYSSDQKLLNSRIQKWRDMVDQISFMKSEKFSTLKSNVRKGIPDCLRIKVWPLLIDKSSEVIDYTKALKQAKFEYTNIIDLDLSRTFPQNIYFKQSGQCYQSLRNLLNVVSVAFPKMGYCQGLNFIAATLILKVNDEQAYDIICHILQNLNHKYLLTNLSLIKKYLFVLQKLIDKNYPDLSNLFKQHQIQLIQFASSWFITLFCNIFPFDYNLRIIDVYLVQGQKILYRIALQLLQYKRKKILQMKSFDDILIFLKNYDQFNFINVDQFFEQMFKIHLSRDTIDQAKFQFKLQSNRL